MGMVCFVPGPDQPAGVLGVSNYLVKPVSRETLLAALDQLALEDKTILIVDDEPEALRLFRRMLDASPQGYRVLRARDGLEAIELAREAKVDELWFEPTVSPFYGIPWRTMLGANRELGEKDGGMRYVSFRNHEDEQAVSAFMPQAQPRTCATAEQSLITLT